MDFADETRKPNKEATEQVAPQLESLSPKCARANFVQLPEYPSGKAQLSPWSRFTPGMPGNSPLPSAPFSPNGGNCWFFPKTNRVPDSLFLGHTRCHRGEALSWSCRSRGYRGGCTTAACTDRRFGTETHRETKCRT